MSHLGGSYPGGDPHTYTPDVWGWILLEFDVRSVVDVGAGWGHNLAWFHQMGCECLAIEGDPEALEGFIPFLPVVKHDYTQGPYVPDRRFDLCVATEFVEHVEAQYESNWIATVKSAEYFLMCHAVPGQGGHHHVNEQTTGYWVERLEREGMVYLPNVTAMLRATCSRKPAPWGRNTLMLFRND